MARRKKRRKIWPPIAVATLCVVAIVFIINYLNPVASNDFNSNADVWVAVNYPVHGIDVSHHQGRIDWPKVSTAKVNQSEIKFAFIRATNGTGKKDVYFNRNWQQCKSVDIPRGAYHYFRADLDPNRQADFFISNVRLQRGDFPPVLDVEDTYGVSQSSLIQRISLWLYRIEAYYGVRPIIYSSTGFYKNHLAGYFDSYPFWVAHYNTVNNAPRVERKWHFWQHSESGIISGIRGKVDFNVFNGSSRELQRLLIQ